MYIESHIFPTIYLKHVVRGIFKKLHPVIYLIILYGGSSCNSTSDPLLEFIIDSQENTWKSREQELVEKGILSLRYEYENWDEYTRDYSTFMRYGTQKIDTLECSFRLNENTFYEGKLININLYLEVPLSIENLVQNWLIESFKVESTSEKSGFGLSTDIVGRNELYNFTISKVNMLTYSDFKKDSIRSFHVYIYSNDYEKHFDNLSLTKQHLIGIDQIMRLKYLPKPTLKDITDSKFTLEQRLRETSNIERTSKYFRNKDIIGIQFDLIYKTIYNDEIGRLENVELNFNIPKSVKNVYSGQMEYRYITYEIFFYHDLFQLKYYDDYEVDYILKKILFKDKSVYPNDYM